MQHTGLSVFESSKNEKLLLEKQEEINDLKEKLKQAEEEIEFADKRRSELRTKYQDFRSFMQNVFLKILTSVQDQKQAKLLEGKTDSENLKLSIEQIESDVEKLRNECNEKELECQYLDKYEDIVMDEMGMDASGRKMRMKGLRGIEDDLEIMKEDGEDEEIIRQARRKERAQLDIKMHDFFIQSLKDVRSQLQDLFELVASTYNEEQSKEKMLVLDQRNVRPLINKMKVIMEHIEEIAPGVNREWESEKKSKVVINENEPTKEASAPIEAGKHGKSILKKEKNDANEEEKK